MESKTYCHSSLASLLTLLFFSLAANPGFAARPIPSSAAGMEFIRSSCNKTDYPALCFASLSGFASTIQTSPMQLADAALSVSLANTRNTSTVISAMSKLPGMSSRVAEAMGDCMETLGDSVEELKQSIQTMDKLEVMRRDARLDISDIQTWVSAALTDENTCMYGFDGKGTKGTVEAAVRGHIVTVAQLTSNALALVNGLASSMA